MNTLHDLQTHQTKLYKQLRDHQRATAKAAELAKRKTAKIWQEIERTRDEIAKARGEVYYQRAQSQAAVDALVTPELVGKWLKDTYAGSEALATIAATRVRKDYAQHVGLTSVPVHAFNRVMIQLGFEVKVRRVSSGGGYVTRAWVRRQD